MLPCHAHIRTQLESFFDRTQLQRTRRVLFVRAVDMCSSDICLADADRVIAGMGDLAGVNERLTLVPWLAFSDFLLLDAHIVTQPTIH